MRTLSRRRPLPPREVIVAQFEYDPATGALRNTETKLPVGKVERGYVRVHVRGFGRFGAHRLIWKVVHGTEPPTVIDHIDRNKSNNRAENLRASNPYLNMLNSVAGDRRFGGIFRGVIFDRAEQRFRACIRIHGRTRTIGTFGSEQEAHAAYVGAVKALDITGFRACVQEAA